MCARDQGTKSAGQQPLPHARCGPSDSRSPRTEACDAGPGVRYAMLRQGRVSAAGRAGSQAEATAGARAPEALEQRRACGARRASWHARDTLQTQRRRERCLLLARPNIFEVGPPARRAAGHFQLSLPALRCSAPAPAQRGWARLRGGMAAAALFAACKAGDAACVRAELARPGGAALVNAKDVAYVRAHARVAAAAPRGHCSPAACIPSLRAAFVCRSLGPRRCTTPPRAGTRRWPRR